MNIRWDKIKKDYDTIKLLESSILKKLNNVSSFYVFENVTDDEIKSWMEYSYVCDVGLFNDSLYIHFPDCVLSIDIPEDTFITQHPQLIKDQKVEYIGIKHNDNYYGSQEYFWIETSNVSIKIFSPTYKLKYNVFTNLEYYNDRNTLSKHSYVHLNWSKEDYEQHRINFLQLSEVIKKYKLNTPSFDYCYLDCPIRPRQFILSFKLKDEYINELTTEKEKYKLLVFENKWSYDSKCVFDINKTNLYVGVRLARNNTTKDFEYELLDEGVNLSTPYFDFLVENYTNVYFINDREKFI